jgi:AcrR family transcriptional regulator
MDHAPLNTVPEKPDDPATLPRWQRRPDARPEEILRAAMEIFVERGFAATRLDEVGARAGVSKGTVYLYFSNKEELFFSTVRESIVPHIQSGEQLIADFHGRPIDLLREMYEGWAAVVTDPLLGGLCKLMIAEAANFPDVARFYMTEVVQRTRAMFAVIIQRCVEAGELRPAAVDLVVREITTPVLFAVTWRHSLASHDDTPFDLPAYLDFHFDIVLQGLQPDTGKKP